MTLDDLDLHRFSFPTAITFGAGARQLLVEHLRANDVGRPLVVTDKGVGALPIFVDLVANLAAGGLSDHPKRALCVAEIDPVDQLVSHERALSSSA